MDNSQSPINSSSVSTSSSNSPVFQNTPLSPSNPIVITPPTSPPQKLHQIRVALYFFSKKPPQKLRTIADIYAQIQPIKLSTQHPLPTYFLASRTTPLEPSTHDQALQDPHWTQAIHAEYQALMDNNTRSLVPKNATMNIIGCRWIFKLKFKSDGSIDCYKARLVAKGYTQEDGFDYMDTFSSVVKITTVQLLLSIAISQNCHIHQLDVSNVFLHGDLTKKLYMSQPPGFLNPQFSNFVYQLKKILVWFKTSSPRMVQKIITILNLLVYRDLRPIPHYSLNIIILFLIFP